MVGKTDKRGTYGKGGIRGKRERREKEMRKSNRAARELAGFGMAVNPCPKDKLRKRKKSA